MRAFVENDFRGALTTAHRIETRSTYPALLDRLGLDREEWDGQNENEKQRR